MVTQLIATDSHYNVKLLPIAPAYCRDMGIAMADYDKLSKAARTFVDFAIQRLPSLWKKIVSEQGIK